MLCLPKNGIQAFSVNFLAVKTATLGKWTLLRSTFSMTFDDVFKPDQSHGSLLNCYLEFLNVVSMGV